MTSLQYKCYSSILDHCIFNTADASSLQFCLCRRKSRLYIRSTTPGIRIPVTLGIKSGIQVPLTGIQCLKSGIHSVKCRIQDCLGCVWMGGRRGQSNLTPALGWQRRVVSMRNNIFCVHEPLKCELRPNSNECGIVLFVL